MAEVAFLSLCVNPLSLISTIVDTCFLSNWDRGSQSSFFNFYYCRFYCLFRLCWSVNPLSLISTIVDKRLVTFGHLVNPLSLISTIVDESYCPAFRDPVNPLSLISTIVDFVIVITKALGQSSFFNFYYCRFLKLIWFSFVNPLSLISTIVDWVVSSLVDSVNPLSLISTIVDYKAASCDGCSQSSFFNFYYCRFFPSPNPKFESILFL